MRLGILEYGAGNMGSVSSAFKRLGTRAAVIGNAKEIAGCDGLVIPGVGSFSAAMRKLAPLEQPIREFAQSGRPILGICLGMQVLFKEGNEGGKVSGLGLLEGNVERIRGVPKLPHVGWNQLEALKGSALFDGISEGTYVYFVHSYACRPPNSSEVIAQTNYGKSFASAVQKGNVFGVQFHPEKSGQYGRKILENFMEVVCQWR